MIYFIGTQKVKYTIFELFYFVVGGDGCSDGGDGDVIEEIVC